MLALYDSESNELAITSNIKRTELYDNLLRRFVRRERSRYVPNFTDKSPKAQEVIIDQEMNRLGVAAIGMYNRQEVVILSKQLEEDLNLFQSHRADGSPKSNTLRESDSVLGGFFFIHKSTALDIEAHSEESESAYEFLHNTFGEFLAADFILRNTINEVRDIYVDRKFKTAGLASKLSNPDAFNSNWFYCLMFVPLYSRPVIIEMLREHLQKALLRASQLDDNSINITFDEFVDNLNFIVQNQLNMILNKRNSSRVMRNGVLFDRDISLLGYLSTYSLNLIVIASAFNSNGFEFCENDYHNLEVKEVASRPWDKLTTLWKVWFSSSDLAGLSVVLRAKRIDNTRVQIICNEKFEATRYEQPIDILLCISSTLADNLLTGLSGLHTHRFGEIVRMEKQDICALLEREDPNLYFLYLTTLLEREINEFSHKDQAKLEGTHYHTINKIIQTLIRYDKIRKINRDTFLNFFTILECCIQRKIIFSSTRKALIETLPRLIQTKVNLKKDIEQPDVIAGIHLIKLLTEGIIPLEFSSHDMYDEPFYRDVLFDLGWTENIERMMYYQSRYVKGYTLFPKILKGNNGYQISFINALENMERIEAEDLARFERQFFTKESIFILIRTDPELLSQALLIMLRKNTPEYLVKFYNIVDFFLKECFDQLLSVGIFYFGLCATANAISIAQLVGKKSFLMDIDHMLQKELLGKHPAAFSYTMYLYPSFVTTLITTLPDTYLEEFLFAIDHIPMRKSILSLSSETLLDYIEMLRKIYELIDRKRISFNRGNNVLHQLERIVHESIGRKDFNFSQLNISQLNNLAWFATLVHDKNLSAKIDAILHF